MQQAKSARKTRTHQPRVIQSGQAGIRYNHFWQLVGMARAAGYGLPDELQPKSIHLGGAHIVTESPAAYLDRIAQLDPAKVAAMTKAHQMRLAEKRASKATAAADLENAAH